MKIVVLGGGSGSRLWPLSAGARSKIFLNLLPAPGGGRESMIRRLWRQLREAGLGESVYVSTNAEQLALVKKHADAAVRVIPEPGRRGTFPAVVFAASYLQDVCGAGNEETVCVLPADLFADDGFFELVKNMDNVLTESGADLAVIGVKPRYPSEAFGYIIPAENAQTGKPSVKVERFAEKPSEEEARAFIRRRALWNCGVYAFKLGFMANWLHLRGYPVRHELLFKQYDRLPAVSFDHEVAENTASIAAVPFAGEWKDLGTWLTLTEEMDTRIIGKGVISEDSQNTHVINELAIPVAVLGISGVIVACGPDGILVADKAASPRLKNMLQAVNAVRHKADEVL